MKFSIPLKFVFVIALVVSGVFLGAKTFIARKIKDTIVPVVVEVQPPNPSANQLVNITITLDSATPTGQLITLGCTDSLAFTDLPSEVVVPAGSSSITFSAHTSTLYTTWAVLAATSNGGTALAIQIR